jgi:hypothetical protein
MEANFVTYYTTIVAIQDIKDMLKKPIKMFFSVK